MRTSVLRIAPSPQLEGVDARVPDADGVWLAVFQSLHTQHEAGGRDVDQGPGYSASWVSLSDWTRAKENGQDG